MAERNENPGSTTTPTPNKAGTPTSSGNQQTSNEREQGATKPGNTGTATTGDRTPGSSRSEQPGKNTPTGKQGDRENTTDEEDADGAGDAKRTTAQDQRGTKGEPTGKPNTTGTSGGYTSGNR